MKKSVTKFIQDQGHLEGCKTQDDLSKLLEELHSDLLEAMLQGELESHLVTQKMRKELIQMHVMRNFKTFKK